MGMINTEDLEEGMVLLADVKSGNQILLAKGATLNSKHIDVFKSWGVDAVDIDGAGDEDLTNQKIEQISPQVRSQMEAELREKFRHVDRRFYPAKALFNACLILKCK
ncbi:MAG: hypothetical protein OEM38_10070 [Gammaproteobacteria bacterium]|nr:hypothetical protein [Gammaproteobacteria bacterium]